MYKAGIKVVFEVGIWSSVSWADESNTQWFIAFIHQGANRVQTREQ